MGKKYGLLIGINEYDKVQRLKGCIDDIDDMNEYLVKNLGFFENDITMLKDRGATRREMENSIKEVLSRMKGGDKLWLHFSGHGTRIYDGYKDIDGICPQDLPINFTEKDLITEHDLVNYFSGLKENVTIVFCSDSCHSGDMKRGANIFGRFINPPKGLEQRNRHRDTAPLFSFQNKICEVRDIKDVNLLAACRSDQTAADALFNDRPNGAFTYYLLEALKKCDEEMYLKDVLDLVEKALEKNNYDQIPQYRGYGKTRIKNFTTLDVYQDISVTIKDLQSELFKKSIAVNLNEYVPIVDNLKSVASQILESGKSRGAEDNLIKQIHELLFAYSGISRKISMDSNLKRDPKAGRNLVNSLLDIGAQVAEIVSNVLQSGSREVVSRGFLDSVFSIANLVLPIVEKVLPEVVGIISDTNCASAQEEPSKLIESFSNYSDAIGQLALCHFSQRGINEAAVVDRDLLDSILGIASTFTRILNGVSRNYRDIEKRDIFDPVLNFVNPILDMAVPIVTKLLSDRNITENRSIVKSMFEILDNSIKCNENITKGINVSSERGIFDVISKISGDVSEVAGKVLPAVLPAVLPLLLV